MQIIAKFIEYIRDVRRYSERTVSIYEQSLGLFVSYLDVGDNQAALLESLNTSQIRSYMVSLIQDRKMTPKTVHLHMSVLSGFCRFLVKEGVIASNPVRLVHKPKVEKRLPEYYKNESLQEYFCNTEIYASKEYLDAFISCLGLDTAKDLYERRLSRLIISIFYSTGLRRSELLSLQVGSVDFGRKVVKVVGKGNKMREIPLVDSLCEEILLYLKAVEAMTQRVRSLKEPLLITYTCRPLYPVYVDRVVKKEFSGIRGITGRRSPHVLRHSLATELMNSEAGLNSIKELLGHSSLATTQVYTHSSIARLKTIYEHAHPRAKNGGKHGD